MSARKPRYPDGFTFKMKNPKLRGRPLNDYVVRQASSELDERAKLASYTIVNTRHVNTGLSKW